MDERLNMSNGDIDRLRTIRDVIDGKLTWSEAADILRLSDRQVGRLCARVREEGNHGVTHRLCGHPSNNRLDEEVLGQALSALHNPLWKGFGPTFSQEKLNELCRIDLGVTTVRELMILTNLWEPHRRGAKHRAWRERRPCVGMMVQLDGSDHDWFEGRGPRCVLIIYIDDATSRILYGEFAKVEDTLTLMRTTRTYLRRRGRPVAFYVDKDGIYKVNLPAAIEEQLRGTEPLSQFTRAMTELGIEMIFAHSPQAKGRVERGFDTHQDRLVKELRLRGIADIDKANHYLWREYIPKHNARYAVDPADPVDVHKPLLLGHDLDAILSLQTPHQVQNDFTVRHDNNFFQLGPKQPVRLRAKAWLTVQERLDGSLQLVFKSHRLKFRSIAGRPLRPPRVRTQRKTVPVPAKPRWLRGNTFAAFSLATSKVPFNPPASAALQT